MQQVPHGPHVVRHMRLLRVAAMTLLLAAPAAPAAQAADTPLPPQSIAARTHFFGAENVDPATGAVRKDRVVLSWFGVSSLALAMNGQVVLLDAYINNANSSTPTSPSDRYVDTSYDELAALRPAALFIGHDHGDHGLGVSFLVAHVPGLRVYGTAEHCAQARDDLATNGYDGVTADCRSVLPEGAPVGGAVVPLPGAIGGACTQVLKHLHSAAKAP